MAAAQMQRPQYPPIQGYSPHGNSPAPGPSPHDPHGRGMYQPPPQMPHMYGYQYPAMNVHHSYPQHHAPPPPPQHHQSMPSHSMLMSHPSQQSLHSQQPLHNNQPPTTGPPSSHINQSPHMHQSPHMNQSSHLQQSPHMNQSSHMGQPSHINQSPRIKVETQGMQRPPSVNSNVQTSAAPASNSMAAPQGSPNSAGGANSNAAPGPIPATTPLVVRQDNNGVQWIQFEYSRDRVKMSYQIRCDVESVNTEQLSQDFKTENCVYPRACCNKDQYRGNRLQYETECNAVGWALAELNTSLRGKRGLIQRAVDSWRNSNSDPKLRSRRVRRQAKMHTRNKQQQQQQHAPPQMPGMAPHSASGVPSSMPAMSAPLQRQAPPQLPLGNSMPHHSPDTNGHDVSGIFHHM